MSAHPDLRAVRVLRALTRGWDATLKHEADNAATALLVGLGELEADLTFARCHPDVLALLEDVALSLRREAEERRVAAPAASTLLERIAALEARMWGAKP